jgi:hypothetical protein
LSADAADDTQVILDLSLKLPDLVEARAQCGSYH